MQGFLNNASSTIADSGGIDGAVTSITLTDGSAFVITDPVTVVCQSEIMLATACVDNVLTVVRGQEGTTAVPHGLGQLVTAGLTKGALDALRADAAAAAIPGVRSMADGTLLYVSSGVPVALAPGTNGQVLTMVSGLPAWAAGGGGGGGGDDDLMIGAVHVSLDDSSGFTQTANALQSVPWQEVEFDHGGYADVSGHPTTLVVPSGKAGIYIVGCTMQNADDTETLGALVIRVNGVEVLFRDANWAPDGNGQTIDATVLLSLAEADAVDFQVNAGNGTQYLDDSHNGWCFAWMCGWAVPS